MVDEALGEVNRLANVIDTGNEADREAAGPALQGQVEKLATFTISPTARAMLVAKNTPGVMLECLGLVGPVDEFGELRRRG